MALAGLVVAALSVRVLSTVAARGTGSPAGAARPDDVVLLLLAYAGVLLAGWLAVGSLLALLAEVPGALGDMAAELADRITPMAARKALTLVLGASVGSIVLPPAALSSAGSGPVSLDTAVGGTVTAADTGPGFVPSRAASAPSPDALTPAFVATSGGAWLSGEGDDDGPGYLPSPPPRVLLADHSRLLAPPPRPTAASHDVVTVRRGDTLWAVAARHLGPGAGDARIACEWPRWYAANRDVIGDDPDKLVPGQQLRPPTGPPGFAPEQASAPEER